MNNKLFDNPKALAMNDFLNYIFELAVSNSDLDITPSLIYNELCAYGVKDTDREADGRLKSVEDLFSDLLNEYKYNSNIRVSERPGFLGFFRDEIAREGKFIKLYIPLDSDHLKVGTKKIFDYLASLGVAHQSRVSDEIRSNNIIIRLKASEIDKALNIIYFIDSDPYIREGLNKCNPFVPTIRGIGFMKETGISYNYEMARLISDYINSIRLSESKASVYYFYNKYIKDSSIFDSDNGKDISKEIKSSFEIALEGNTNSREYKDPETSEEKKMDCFLTAIRATYENHDIKQVAVALYTLIKYGDYSYFSNGNKNHREELKKNVSQADAISLIDKLNGNKLASYNPMVAVNMLLSKLYSNDMTIKIENICKVTLAKYGPKHLIVALGQYIYFNDASGFSRYLNDDKSVNYRRALMGYSSENVLDAISNSLYNRGIEARRFNPDTVINEYVGQLYESLRYEQSGVPSKK